METRERWNTREDILTFNYAMLARLHTEQLSKLHEGVLVDTPIV